jgi:DNA-binding Xre family transcriptional regulator
MVKIQWKQFASDIRAERASRDRGLRQFAKDIRMDKATVCRAEGGKPLTAANFLALCAACNCSPWAYFRSGH